MKKTFAVLAGLTLLAIAAPAVAETTSLGTIPTLPAPHDAVTPPKVYGVTGLSLKEMQQSRSSYYETTAATKQGYCLIERDSMLRLEDTTMSTNVDEMWRLTEKDGTATLERTRFEIAGYLENAWVKSRTSIDLRIIASDQGVTVWAMREANGDLVLIARGSNGGRESHLEKKVEEGESMGFSSSSCTYGATRISAYTIAHGGGIAQLTGGLPPVGEGKDKVSPHFTADISALKLSRDPEPVITVRVRVGQT